MKLMKIMMKKKMMMIDTLHHDDNDDDGGDDDDGGGDDDDDWCKWNIIHPQFDTFFSPCRRFASGLAHRC